MVQLVLMVLVDQLLRCIQLGLFWVFKDAHIDHEVLGPVRTFDFVYVKLSFQSMVDLIVNVEQFVHNLNDWVVVPVVKRVGVYAHIIGYEHLLPLFQFEDK